MRSAAIFPLLFSLVACQDTIDLCNEDGCEFSAVEWERLQSLHLRGVQPNTTCIHPPLDPANRWVRTFEDSVAEPGECPEPLDNPVVELGLWFFHDPRFSGVATQTDILGRLVAQPARTSRGEPLNIACATCHDPKRGGVDRTSVPGHVSVGAGWYDVNALSVVNAAYYPLKYWNGRYDSLVWQVIAVGESRVSMNGDRVNVARVIYDVPEYRGLYGATIGEDYPLPAFGRSREEEAARLAADGQCVLEAGLCPAGCVTASGCWPRFPLHGKPGDGECDRSSRTDGYDCMSEADRSAIDAVYVGWAKAIAAYEHELTSRPSRFDRWLDDGPDSELLDAKERLGAKLFVGRAACIDCHSGALLTDFRFHNTGVPQAGAAVPTQADCPDTGTCVAYGWHAGLSALQANTAFRITGGLYSDTPDDMSRQRFYDLELVDRMKGQWRTPSLREVADTAPYMHDGYHRTLEEVVRHYDAGGTPDGIAPAGKSKRLAPLGLNDREVGALVSFLTTLTGDALPEGLVEPPVLP